MSTTFDPDAYLADSRARVRAISERARRKLGVSDQTSDGDLTLAEKERDLASMKRILAIWGRRRIRGGDIVLPSGTRYRLRDGVVSVEARPARKRRRS